MDLDSYLCALCQEHIETEDHLFASCNKALEVRKDVNAWWKVLPDRSSNLQEFFGLNGTTPQAGNLSCIKLAITQAYFWFTWKGMNDVIFKGADFKPLLVANDIKSWVHA